MDDICRLCMSVYPEMMYVLSEECEVLKKIRSCLFLTISLNETLPNQVCQLCIEKLDIIQNFQKVVAESQDILSQYLNLGEEKLSNFYLNLKNGVIKQEIKTFENKENDNLNVSTNIQNESSTEQDNIIVKHEILYNVESIADYSSEDDLTLSSIKTNKKQEKVEKRQKRIKKTEPLQADLADSKEIDQNADIINETLAKNVQISDFQHKCLTCYHLFDSQTDLLHHYNKEHGPKKSEDTTTVANYVTVSDNGSVTYKCMQCEKVYVTKRAINRHMISHTDNRPFVCKMCGRTYKTASDIIRHGRAHSSLKLHCSYQCGYSTVYSGALKEHERRHGSDFKYKCEKCDKGFQVKTWYEEHQNIHNNIKPFVCSICGLAFHLSRYLTAHRSAVHPQSSSLKRYVCVHCSLPCDSRNTLTEHLKEHGIKTSFLCDICGKTLSNAEHLKFHKRMHLGIKPYSCSSCDKSFTRKLYLSLHARTHAGPAARLQCACGKRYAQRASLRRHHHKHHASAAMKCPKCDKPFTKPSQLYTHQKQCII